MFINTANESGLFHGASFQPEYMDLYGRNGHNHLHDNLHHLHHDPNDADEAAGAGTDDADEAHDGDADADIPMQWC